MGLVKDTLGFAETSLNKVLSCDGDLSIAVVGTTWWVNTINNRRLIISKGGSVTAQFLTSSLIHDTEADGAGGRVRW